ncbi:9251_t:CDS:2, partial [Racocetra fulgida]
MSQEEAVEFVKNDGSSGGCVRIGIITEDGLERRFFPGNELPELAKEVYIKEGLRPPTISEISQAFSDLQSIRLRDITEIGLREAARIAIRSVEVFGFFALGEMIGRR